MTEKCGRGEEINETLESLSWMISRLRLLRGMTQTELAEKIGVSQSYVSMLEAGGRSDNRFSFARILGAIADALGVPVGLLFLPPEGLPEGANEEEKYYLPRFQQTYYDYLSCICRAQLGRGGGGNSPY